jgi:hypothetical protein
MDHTFTGRQTRRQLSVNAKHYTVPPRRVAPSAWNVEYRIGSKSAPEIDEALVSDCRESRRDTISGTIIARSAE